MTRLSRPQPGRSGPWWLVALLLVALGGLWLRLDGIGERLLCHPENFAPGIVVPDWVRYPPARQDLESVVRGTLIDGHPPTYFVGLLPWTNVFGASLTSLRTPSALLGTVCIVLVFLIALREGSRWTALLAASLIALHGHHVYWSQLARMYVPAACLALLSTWFLLRVRERGRAVDVWAYFVATVLALWTQLYTWPFLLAQMLGALLLDVRDRRAPSMLRVQVLAILASVWVVQLSIYQNPPTRWHGAASEYLELGYLFHSRTPFLGVRPDFALDGPWLLALGIALLAFAAFAPRRPAITTVASATTSVASLPRWFELCVAVGATTVLLGFAAFAPARARIDWTPIWAICAAPIVITIGYLILERYIARRVETPPAWLARIGAWNIPLGWQLALVPVACMVLVSLARGVLVARGTIVFLPFMSIAIAHALVGAFRVRAIGATLLVLVLGLHVMSVQYFRRADSTPRDYGELARQLLAEVKPTDVIAVRDNYSYPPLLHYLADVQAQCVPDKWPDKIRSVPHAVRIWVVRFSDDETAESMLALVDGRIAAKTLTVHGASAVRYDSP